MRLNVIVASALLMIMCGCTSSPTIRLSDKQPEWLVGYWHVTYDEDGTPPDWTEFKSNGEFAVISPECKELVGRYHVFDGDAYLTYMIPGKGPVALVYRPSPDKMQLFYTSIRTRRTATLEKVQSVPCKSA